MTAEPGDLLGQLRAPVGRYGQNSEDGGESYDDLRLKAAEKIELLQDSLTALLGIVTASFPSMSSPSMRAAVDTARALVEKPKRERR